MRALATTHAAHALLTGGAGTKVRTAVVQPLYKGAMAHTRVCDGAVVVVKSLHSSLPSNSRQC